LQREEASSAGSRDGDHVHSADGFVAIRDIAPKAPTHLLILPRAPHRHVPDVGELEADEAKRMLEFGGRDAAEAGSRTNRLIVNVGPGRRADRVPPPLASARGREPPRIRMTLIAASRGSSRTPARARDDQRRDALALVLNALRSAERNCSARSPTRSRSRCCSGAQEARRGDGGFDAAGLEEQADREEFELDVIGGVHARTSSPRTSSRRSWTT
jgi:hypothetical protein